jgi:hypothetical protein
MKLDENAAAFGLFHITFANLVQQFAVAVFLIRKLKDPSIKFEDVFKRDFGALRDDLKDELKQFDAYPLHNMELQEIRAICSKAGTLAAWRNPRIHARVKLEPNGITVYDSKTGKQLSINRDECSGKIEEAVGLALNLDFNMEQLLKNAAASLTQTCADVAEIFKTIEDHAD